MSPALESILKAVDTGLKSVFTVDVMEDAVRVTTHCMYPSNGLIRVTVRGGTQTIIASDEGETVGEAISAGIHLPNPDKMLRPLIRAQGIDIHRGVIHSPRMGFEAAALAVILVANSAKEASHWLYEHHKIKRDRDFRKLLREFLEKTFSEQVAETKIVGKSNKEHKFSNVISFATGNKLIIDPVVHEATAINSRVIANLDVRNTMNPRIDQRIIYDDSEDWSAAELNLLNIGAAVVPYSRAYEVIPRVAKGLQ